MTKPFNSDDYWISLELQRTISLDCDADDPLENTHGRILATSEDSELIELGSLELCHVKPSISDDFIFIADAEDASLSAAVLDVFDVDTNELKPQISGFYGGELECGPPDFIFIRRIEISPEYRGHGIGSRCMRALLNAYDDTYYSLIIVKPNRVGPRDEHWNKEQSAETSERLTRFYERLGFRKLVEEHMTYCTLLAQQPDESSRRGHRRSRSALSI